MSTTLSLVTVCLDSAATIGCTVRSVADQIAAGDQYVIVDGGSRDDTLQIVEAARAAIEGRGAELVVSSGPDAGIYDAMNIGIARCSGDAVGLINADDWYLPGAFDTVRRVFDSGDAEIVHGALDYYVDGRLFRRELIHHDFLHRRMIPHPTCFVRREVYERLGGFSTRYRLAGDYEFMLRCRKHGVRFELVPDALAGFADGGRSNRGARSRHETLLVRREYGLIDRARYRLELIESRIRLFFRG